MINIPNSTQIPNEIINGWLPKLSESELKVLIIVARQTLGWIGNLKTGMRKEEDWMTLKQLMKRTGLSQYSVTKAISSLVDKNLIEVRDEEGNVLNSPKRRQEVGRSRKKLYYRLKTKTSLKFRDDFPKKLQSTSLKFRDNKTKYNKTKIIQKYKRLKKYSSLKDIKEEDLIEIAQRYRTPLAFVKLQLETLKNYCEAKGRRYKNYKAALRNFVISEAKRQIERSSQDDAKRGIDARSV